MPITVQGTPPKRRSGDWSTRGPALWAELHARPATYSGDTAAELAWLDAFAARVPCGDCRRHWRELVEKMPPDLTSAAAYERWTIDAHNAVNVELGKPVWIE